ncbi:MAG: imidazole glycerol phosphate synthase subunit HisH, partial [Clostridia bacterium]|nr:imidazole glycerol phosphate synthase subunit HisH [Clostridia bacterium]
RDREIISKAKALVLPGVGAFGKGMENLKRYNLISLIREVVAKGTPFLGICLGMQLMFEESEEYGVHKGMGLLKGKIKKFPEGMKVPHMGWNTLDIKKKHKAVENIQPESFVYFVHSYYVSDCVEEQVIASTNYGVEILAIVCFNNMVGIQFHPEKSSQVGLKILKNFGELVRNVNNSCY